MQLVLARSAILLSMTAQFPTPILRPLFSSPQLPAYFKQIKRFVDDEQRKRNEFYDWITEDTRAEFINGEIIVQSPAKKQHNDISANLVSLLRTYVDLHELGFLGYETVLVSLTRNDYLPDICYFSSEKADHLSSNQMKFPAPDLIAEILSPSTAKVDRTVKFEDYAAHGVTEYWLIDPDTETVEQYELNGEAYELLFKMRTGLLSSVVVSGFSIPVEAIFSAKIKNDALRVLLSSKN